MNVDRLCDDWAELWVVTSLLFFCLLMLRKESVGPDDAGAAEAMRVLSSCE